MDEEDREIVTNATYRQAVELGNFVSFRDEISSRMMKDKRKAVGLEGKGIAKIFIGSIGLRNVVMAHDTKKRQGCLLVKALKMEIDTMNF